jgi:hypothetical protein
LQGECGGCGGLEIEHEREISAPRVFVTAELRWLYDGYVEACARFQAAGDAHLKPEATFIPLFETLNWAASFELFMKEQRQEPLEDDLVHAFGLARNRVHHQWAAALKLVEASLGPVQPPGGSQIVGTYGRWHWKSFDELPPSSHRDPKGEAAYPELLAGRSVRPTLRELQDIFQDHV